MAGAQPADDAMPSALLGGAGEDAGETVRGGDGTREGGDVAADHAVPADTAAAEPAPGDGDPTIEDCDSDEKEVSAPVESSEVPEVQAEAEEESSDDERLRRTARPAPAAQPEPVVKKEVDTEAKSHVMTLHSSGKSAKQIRHNYLLADYDITEEAVLAIIRECQEEAKAQALEDRVAAPASGGGAAASTATHSLPELKEWMEIFKKGGDLDRMRALLALHPSLLNATHAGIGNAALHWVAAQDKTIELRFLLDNRADVSVRNAAHATPLHSAASHGKVGALMALLQAGADVTAKDEDGATPRGEKSEHLKHERHCTCATGSLPLSSLPLRVMVAAPHLAYIYACMCVCL